MFNLGYQGAGMMIYHVQEKNKVFVLLGKRINNPDKGLWSIPGGGWESTDVDSSGNIDLAETARREMQEELGFYLPRKQKNFMSNIWNLDMLVFKFKVFALRMKSKKIPYRHFEFSDMRWFDINNIPAGCFCNKFVHSQVNDLKRFLVEKGHLTKV